MFGMMFFRGRVLKVLSERFGYVPKIPGIHTHVFNESTRFVRSLQGNEYDAAALFIFIQLRVLASFGTDPDEVRHARNEAWAEEKCTEMEAIAPLTVLGLDRIAEAAERL